MFDIAAHSQEGELQLVVEVKASKGASEEWGRKLRRNLVVHGLIPSSKFFLLALPTYIYLWRDNVSTEVISADYKVSTKQVLRPYLLDLVLEDISEQSFEILVMAWLRDLISSELTPDSAGPELKWLFDSGLLKSIRHGSLSTNQAI